MKALNDFIKKIKPSGEGKFPILHALWDGTYTFLFVPGHTNKNGVHVRDGIDLKRTMIMVVLAMIPALLFGMFNVGHQHLLAIGEVTKEMPVMEMFMDKFLFGALKVLPLVVVSYGVGLGIEFVFAALNKHSIHEGFLVSGMLIPLIMPVDVPLWMVAVATAFAVIIGKEVFGGTGMNIVNVALTARAFLFFAYPTKMSGDQVWINGVKLLHEVIGRDDKGDLINETLDSGTHVIRSKGISDYEEFTWKIPEGSYLAIGDNRDNSLDSRVWGYFSDKYLIGKAEYIWLHWGSFSELPGFFRNGRIQ